MVFLDDIPKPAYLAKKQLALLTFFFFSKASVLPNPSRTGAVRERVGRISPRQWRTSPWAKIALLRLTKFTKAHV